MLKVKKTSCHCEIAYSYTCWITIMTATMGTLLCICCLSLRHCTAVSGCSPLWPRAHYSVSVASAFVTALLFLVALCCDQGHITLCLLPQPSSLHCCFWLLSAVTKGTLLCVCCLSLCQCTAVSGHSLLWPRAHYSVSVASAMVTALLFPGALCRDQGHLTLCCLGNGQCTAVSGRPLPRPRAHYSVSVAWAMVSALLFLGALCHDQGHVTLCLLPQQWSVHCCFQAPFALGTMGHQSEGGCTLHCLLLHLVFLLCTSSCFFFSSHTFPWTQYGCKF